MAEEHYPPAAVTFNNFAGTYKNPDNQKYACHRLQNAGQIYHIKKCNAITK
jgi:hypothetical protein